MERPRWNHGFIRRPDGKKYEIKELYPSFDDYMRDFIGATYDEEKKDWGVWTNPNRQFCDWNILEEYKNSVFAPWAKAKAVILPNGKWYNMDLIRIGWSGEATRWIAKNYFRCKVTIVECYN